MFDYGPYVIGVLLNFVIFANSESFYSVVAPGVIKSNHNYMVVVSLHEAPEPAKINIRIQGPYYYMENEVYLKPYETTAVVFVIQKLVKGDHKLVVEGKSGILFRNETSLFTKADASPKMYIQTDKAVYKPGDEVQFRIVMLDVHTRPLKIEEPIRVDILDGAKNRVKQFKDIALVKGIYKNKFQLSDYPVMGTWEIRVSISGRFDNTESKTIQIRKYVLPKFSVYIKAADEFVRNSGVLKALVYGKYTFQKNVEGNMTAKLLGISRKDPKIIQEQKHYIKDMLTLEFHFETPSMLQEFFGLSLEIELMERHTGITQKETQYIYIADTPYSISVDSNTIEFRKGIPYRFKAHVAYGNGPPVVDQSTAVTMKHGSNEYEACLDDNGDATFEFEHVKDENHIIKFQNATYYLSSIFANEDLTHNDAVEYCKLTLKGKRLRLGIPVEIEVTSIENIPYLIYTIVGHANIIHTDYIDISPNQKSHTIQITPSIEMVPYGFVYVYYVKNGNLRYDEIKLEFPLEFENKISVLAPKQVKPGQEITLELKAQPKSYVGILAVDLGVYLLDPTYDLQRDKILRDLQNDITTTPLPALIYPGIYSGVVTLTNAHYKYVKLDWENRVSPNSLAPPKFRQKFPETWIFENYEITDESTKLTFNIPDTITTWRITAFSVNDQTGFGIVDGPTDVTTIQSFFIVLNLPYSVKRGEIIAIPVIIYNYHEQSLDAEITMYNEASEFYFMEAKTDKVEKGANMEKRVKQANVAANNAESVTFLIRPKQVGELTLRIIATNPLSSDAVIQKLKVEPEGLAKYHNKALNINSKDTDNVNATFLLKIPMDIVPDSEFIKLSLSGDNLVPTLENLNGLVLLPTGCGEQNMVNLAPNILVLQYLKAAGRYYKEKELVKKAKKYIELGYQQQLSYRHSNGGYSVFGQGKDEEPSTWLTAYVIRFFIKATKYIPLEERIVASGLEYVSSNQMEDGSFRHTGYLLHSSLKNRYGFTAFVLMTFLENEKYASKYKTSIENGLKFLKNNIDKIDNIYALSIMAATLKMANDSNAQRVLEKLALRQHMTDEHIWWTQSDENREKDVEITSYIFMALLDDNNDPKNDFRILRWLLEQRNERGGFKSTHDTVVGLQALVKSSQKYNNADNINLNIKYVAKNNESKILKTGKLNVDQNNALVLQTEEFPKQTRSIYIQASGVGQALLQLSYQYHQASADEFKHFQIEAQAKMLNADEILLDVCFTYKPVLPSNVTTTNMIIMETNLLSGFKSSDEHTNDLLDNEIVERVELTNEETSVVLYFKKLSANVKNCLSISGDKLHDVAMRKPASIAIYDYYNINRYDSVFYTI